MGIFQKIKRAFYKGNEGVKPTSPSKIPVTELNPTILPEGQTLICASEVPSSLKIGNLVFEKKYQEAIELGLKLLKDAPEDGSVHINLMDAYFKGRNLDPSYFEKSTYHARMAMLCGHHTGYAEQRLAINLDKLKLFHQSVQLYDLILNNKDFHFSEHGIGKSIDFEKRRNNALQKMSKALDDEGSILFSQAEIKKMLHDIAEDDRKKVEHDKRYNAIMKQIDDALKKGDMDKCDRLFEELHSL